MSAIRLTVHDHAAGFIAAAAEFLHCAEAENSMISMPAARMAMAPSDDDAGTYLATVTRQERVVAAALHGASGSILLTAAPDAAAALIANDLADRGRSPRSLVGPLAPCEDFARTWRGRTGQAHMLRFHLRHFELTTTPAASQVRGRLRLPEPGEHLLISEWQLAFAAEAGLPDEGERVRRNVMRRIARGLVRVWDDEGAVAFVAFGEGAATARIAPVYTPPRFRGRGYASAMVAALSRELIAAGKRALFLTTDVANPTSNGIYRRIGFQPVADHFHFDFVAAPA